MSEKYPDKEMFVFYVDNERFTFKQMKAKSQKFAASLVSKGLKKGDTIAILGANHSEWIVALYASIQLGILLVPLRLEFPHSTIVAIMNKLQCKAIILTRSPDELLDRACEYFPEMKSSPAEQLKSDCCPHLQFLVLCSKSAKKLSSKTGVYSYDDFMTLGNETDISKVEEICKSLDIDDPCCIYFTSGSTGMPKPAVHSHHSILNNAMTGAFFRMGVDNFNCNWESLRYMVGVTLSGTGTVWGTYLPIARGCTTIVLYPAFNAGIMAEALQNERVSIGTVLIHQAYDLLNLPNIDSYDFSNLKLMGMGGSIIPNELRQKMKKLVQYTTNCYGMTEMLMTHVGDPVDPPDKSADAATYAIDGFETKIVDDNGIIVPVETVGEILVRGYSAFKYYLADDLQTKERKDSNGWIHTGDLGVMDEAGFLTIKGRKKDIILKEAVNLIPVELEAVLYEHPKVLGAMVIGLPDERVGEEICACIRVDRDNSPTEEDIMEFCRGKVYALLVPKYVLFFDEFPTTPNGKYSRLEATRIAKEAFNI
ncbi:medium-chain acyl-CoA ligase ACSF2, mitochondrial-like [Amphiura filiformis]|uniref:medium-chain acyl-CoA ligase ACSF2, mitochondrial-like n=1 Tax=Amphiura filiformis TaxID=82378 RepID=UPI003B2216FF